MNKFFLAYNKIIVNTFFPINFNICFGCSIDRVGSHVVFAWIHCTDVLIHCTDILIECR